MSILFPSPFPVNVSYFNDLSNLCQIFVKSLSNLCQILILFPWMLLLAMIFWKHSSTTVRRRKTSKLRSIWKHSDQPALLQNGSQKVFLILYNQLKSLLCLYKYPMDWSHCHWNIIFPGILRRFGGWLLRNRACLIFSQNHALQYF